MPECSPVTVVNLPFTIRQAISRDNSFLADVMFDAVRNGASEYSETQRIAWVPSPPAGEKWSARLDSETVVLAEDAQGPVGFMTLTPFGYIDLAYIRPRARGQGLFKRLYESIENNAILASVQRVHVHASRMARGPFESVGFSVAQREQINIGSETLERFEMVKILAANS